MFGGPSPKRRRIEDDLSSCQLVVEMAAWRGIPWASC
jgi:hypothetical protein